MTFFVRKSLAHGPIRFGVTPRQTLDQVDTDPGLSTGAAGEFLRRRTSGFFFADTRRFGAPVIPQTASISSTSFWSSLKPDGTPRGWGLFLLLPLGLLLIVIGLAVVVNKGSQGWIEVILGLAMVSAPIIVTARKRQMVRAQEEKERAEREERERRERKMLADYTAALEKVRRDPSEQNLTAAKREVRRIELPYEIWSGLAKRTALDVAFALLDRLTIARAGEVAERVNTIAASVGLTPADRDAVKLDLYRVVIWHLLADDRLGETQLKELDAFRRRFGIADPEVAPEENAAGEFRLLRGVTNKSLPRQESPIALGFGEYCIHSTRGSILNEKLAVREACALYVTNKRVLVDGRKRIEVPLPKIDDVEVDFDENYVVIRTGKPIKPVYLRLEQPIYSAALIDLATNIDERPRGFA